MKKIDTEALQRQARKILKEQEMYPRGRMVQQTDMMQLASKLNVQVVAYSALTETQVKLHRKKLTAPAATIMTQNTRVICYDDRLPQASTYVAHELAHILLKHEQDTEHEEMAADILAHYLLYPVLTWQRKHMQELTKRVSVCAAACVAVACMAAAGVAAAFFFADMQSSLLWQEQPATVLLDGAVSTAESVGMGRSYGYLTSSGEVYPIRNHIGYNQYFATTRIGETKKKGYISCQDCALQAA